MTEYQPRGVLEGVFRELVARNIPLGMRDYLEGLRALNLGFGCGSRGELRILCHRLWARNDIERRAIDLIFTLIPVPVSTDTEIQQLNRRLETSSNQPQLDVTNTEQLPRDVGGGELQVKSTRAGVMYGGASEGEGIELSDVTTSVAGRETYVLQPQTLFPERYLAVIWRRLRTMVRRGAARELDIEGTIRDQCRHGVLPYATLRPVRRNTSGLLVLVDVSASMAPWRPFLQAVSDSLPLGNLRKSKLLYFSNYPRDWLFLSPALKERVKFEDILKQYSDNVGLLIFSDAGAVRGRFNPQRIKQTAEFLDRAHGPFKPIVWINPMPRERWQGTSAEALSKQTGLSVFPLERELLVRAIDVLRGERQV